MLKVTLDPNVELYPKPTSVDDLPEWNYDGSSTGQAPGHDSDVYLRPVAFILIHLEKVTISLF